MKTYSATESSIAGRRPAGNRAGRARGKAQRECITLSDPTDCLLEAYDCVARRAYEHFLARDARPDGELEDWLSAERELLLGFAINVQESEQFVYALASIPGATAARLEIGIESRWLVILAQALRPAPSRRAGVVSNDRTRSLGLGLSISRCADLSVNADRGPSKSVCILELPACVDTTRSIAILSDGLLAIRMPKFTARQ